MEKKKNTVSDILNMKKKAVKITMLTAYDFPTACVLDEAGIDIILVGDSLGNVILGYESTVPVTMDEMIHHAKAVKKGTKFSLLVGDMPFMSFNVSPTQTIKNAGRFIKEAGVDAVKMEGGNAQVIKMIKAVTKAGIPVMGHVGLTPQTAIMLSGYKVQGKNAQSAKDILQQAYALQKAGCFSVVLECIPDALAQLITKKITIPTIGIGAGKYCDGQVLVTHDMLGLYEKLKPKFVKQYARLSRQINIAIGRYIQEVRDGKFPQKEHVFTMDKAQLEGL